MAKVYISLHDETAELREEFIREFSGHQVIINPDNRTTPLDGGKSKMEEANEWGADLYIAVRQGGDGLSVKAAGQDGSRSWELCEAVHKELVTLLPSDCEDKGVSNGDALAEISRTNMTSVYVVWHLENDLNIVEYIAEPCLEWLSKLNANPPIVVPDDGDKPEPKPETPDTSFTGDISDAELGAAFRTVAKAFWESRNV